MLNVRVLGFSGGLQAADTVNTSLVVSTMKTSILIDTSGSPFNALLSVGVNPNELDAVVLTHAHVDHLYAFPSLIHNLWLSKREKPLIVTGNKETIEKAKELYKFFLLDRKKMMEIIWLDSVSKIRDISISTFPLFHRPLVPTNGFTFTCDQSEVSYFPDSAATSPYPSVAMNSDIIFHEAGDVDINREKLREQGHSSGYLAGDVATILMAKKLVLVHLPSSNSTRLEILDDAKRRFSNSYLAEKDFVYSC